MVEEKILITLDTNVLQEFWKDREKKDIVEKLISLSKIDQIDLAVTARVREDIPNEPLSKKINELREINISETGSFTRLDYWVLNRDQLACKEFADFFNNFENDSEIKNSPDWRDIDHLHAHYLQKRDIFLTWDKGILYFKDILNKKFGLTIQKPEDFIKVYFE